MENPMKAKYTLALTLLVGIALGAVATQGLHAQAKLKGYLITETEILDGAALAAYTPLVRAAVKAAGGRLFASPEGLTVTLVGEAPKRVAITEWDSVEAAQAFRNSEAFRNLATQRDKAVKTIRVYIKEAVAN
jgi:uncharacterized protein (DUF1330 family)